MPHRDPRTIRVSFMASLSPPRFFFVIALGLALSLALVVALAVAAIGARTGLPL